MSRSVHGRAWHSAPQVAERGRTTARASPAGDGRSGLAQAAVGHPDQDREVHPVGEDRRLPGRQRDQVTRLGRGRVHRRADRLAIVGGRETVHDLDRRVLDHVRDEPGRDLLGDDQPLAVRADLRQQAREHLDRVPGRAAPGGSVGGLRPAQQPVRLLHHRQMPKAAGVGRAAFLPPVPRPGPVGEPQVLSQPDEHRAHQKRLVRVVADVLDLEHHVPGQQRAEVDRVPALEEAAGRAVPEAGQPDPDEAEHVVGDPLGVADLGDDPFGRALQGGEGRVGGGVAAVGRLAEREVPARVLVDPAEGGAEHLRERLLGPEGRDEQRSDQVGVRLQREPGAGLIDRGLERVEPGRNRVGLARPDPDDLRAREPRGHQPVLGLGGLDHQPRGALPGRGLEQGPHGLRLARPGGAADEHVPVERIARQDERAGRPQVPVEDLAQPDARVTAGAGPPGGHPAGRSWVTSNSGRSASRTPGTSDSGGRASAARNWVDP